jgi:hypothetical protein
MPIYASSAQIAAQPVQSGTRTLQVPANVTAAAPFGGAIDTPCDTFSVSLGSTGALDSAAVLTLQATINGSSFLPVYINGSIKTWTGAQITAGVIETLNVKAVQVRLVLSTLGTTTGSSGVVPRLFA